MARADITTSLVGLWRMDEGTGTVSTADSSGNGNTATMFNMVSGDWGAGKISNRLSFNGSNKWLRANDSASLDTLTNKMTFAAWVYKNANQASYTVIASRQLSAERTSEHYFFSFSDNYLLFLGKNITWTSNAATSPPGSWIHVAATYDATVASPQVRLYVNGSQVATGTSTGVAAADSTYLAIGCGQGDSTATNCGEWFNGYIDDLRIYSRALTASDITELYNYTGSGPRYWIGGTSGNFTDNTRWSTTAGGANNAWAPGAGDAVVFTGATGSCTIDDNVSVTSITLASTYTGAVSQGTYTVTTSDDISVAGGTFTGGSGDITVGDDLLITGGTFTDGTGTMTVTDAFTQNGGTFTKALGSMMVGGAFSLATGSFTAPPTLNVAGAFSHTGGTYTHSSGTVKLKATAPQNLAATGPLYNLELGTAVQPGTNTGLVLHWKLDETVGTTATDASGNGNDGTLTGTSGVPSWSTDLPSQIDFANARSGGFTMASRHAIEIAVIPAELKAPTLTMSAWYKATAVDSSGSDIISIGDNQVLRIGSSYLQACKRVVGTHVCLGPTVSGHLDGNWRHIAATFSATGMKIYLDGVEMLSNSDSQTAQYNLGPGFWVGRHGWDATNFDFGGNIDDVRVYDTALSPTAIQNLYRGSGYSDHGNGSDSGLVAYWKLDEPIATAASSYAQDSSGNGHHATYVATSGSPTTSTDVATGFDFPNGRSMDFNDTNNQGAQLNSLATALKPSTVSISAWVKGVDADLDTAGGAIVDVGTGYDLGFTLAGIPRIKKFTGVGTSVDCAGTSDAVNGAWHHIVGILEPTGARVYVDGVLQSTGCNNVSSIFYSTTKLEIGRDPAIATEDWGGLIDDVRVYDRALTGAEVAILYAGAEFTDGTNSTEGESAATGTTHTLVGNLTVANNLTLNTPATLNGGAGSYTIAVTGAWSNGGTFTAGNSTVELKNTTGGALPAETWYGLKINGSGSTWTLPGTLTIPGDLTITAGTLSTTGSNHAVNVAGSFVSTGTFSGNSSTVTLDGTASGKALTVPTGIYSLTVNGSGGVWTLGGNTTIGQNVTLTAGTLAGSSRTILVAGSWTNNGGTFTIGTSTVSFNATAGSKTITTRSGQSFNNVTFAGVGGGWTLQDAIDINGDFAMANGTLATGNFAMTIGGSFNLSYGAFHEGTGTITLDGANTNEIIRLEQTNLYNLVVNGTGTWTLNTTGMQLDGTLTVSNGSLVTSNRALTVVGAGTVNGGRLSVGTSGSATMREGLTVSSGTLELSSTGILNITNGQTLSITGTLKDTSTGGNSTIRATSGGANTYVFTVNSGATIDIDGMNIQDTDVNGMRFPAAAGVTFTNFKNVAFTDGSTTATAKYLNMTATALDLTLLGFSFDNPGAGTLNVALAGDGTANQTQLVLECNTTTGVGGAGCGDARDADDDANDDGVADNPGSNGGIVHWLRNVKTDLTGTLVGMPTRAINWNDFSYYATYAGYNNASTTQARVTVRDADGTSSYSYDFTAGETMTGSPRSFHDGTNKYVFVGMTNGKVYKLLDNGSSLAVSANWPTIYAGGSTITTPLSVDATYIYFAGLSGAAVGTSTYRAVFRVTHTGVSPVWGSIFGTGTSASSVLTAAPALAPIAATDYLFFGVNDHFFRVQASNMTGNDNTVASGDVTSRVTIVNSRFYAGDDVGKLWVMNAAQSTLGQLWVYQDTAGHGGSCSTITCKISNFYVHLLTDYTVRVYWGDADGHVYAVQQNGVAGEALTGYPFSPDSATSAYNAAPLFDNGTLVVGNAAGSVYVINAATTSAGNPSLVRLYRFGSANPIATITMDRSTYAGAGGYVVATTSGRWYYLPRYTDPDAHR